MRAALAVRVSRRRFLAFAASAAGAAALCWQGTPALRGQRASAADVVHWDYSEHGGAGGWGELHDGATGALAFPDCNLTEQSPVDIPRRAPLSRASLTVDYQATTLIAVNNGHTVQVPFAPGSTLTIDGKAYRLLQLHFHAPAEHLLHGRAFPLEAHLVHQADDGELAVLGVLARAGRPHAAFEAVLRVMPMTEGSASSSGTLSAAGFLPGDLTHYAYPGSLTTPPCTEGVRWSVLRESIEVSETQLTRFRDLPFLNEDGSFTGNARAVQPLNGRLGAEPAPTPTVRPPNTGSAGLLGTPAAR